MSRTACVLGVCLLVSRGVLAQTTASGGVGGTATDPQGAVLPGVTVSITSVDPPVARAATTDSGGKYSYVDVPPGTYVLTAELAGFARLVQAPVIVLAGTTIRVDLEMMVGAVTETIEVTQEAPLLESLRASQAVNISGELLRGVPLSERREWFGALLLAPGVTTAQWVNNETLVSVHGADSSANIVQIDGADMSASLTSGVGYISMNTDAVEDIQIKTAGLDASAPLGVGGIVNIAVNSGTNQLKGAATVFFQPLAWNASNSTGSSSTVDQTLIDLSAGGPIVKDQLWAFGSYRHVDAASGVSRTPAQIGALQTLAPGYVPLGNTNVAQYSLLKINAKLSAAHQLEGFYEYDTNPVTFTEAASQFSRAEATGGNGASVRFLSIWSDHLTTRIGASFNDKRRDGRDPQIPGPDQIVYQGTIVSAGRLVGNGRLASLQSPVTAWNGQPNSKLTLSLDATVVTNHRTGLHEIQTGLYAQPRTRLGLTTSYVNGGYILEEAVPRVPGVLGSGLVPFHRIVLDGNTLTNARRVGHDYAAYVQDAWRPTPRLTINAGVRVDRIEWDDTLFGVTSEDTTAVGPRVGVNYALTADTRHVTRAHWVRVHDQPSQTATSVGTASLGQHDVYDLNLDGTFETSFFTPATTTVTPGRTIDSSFHQPFIDEWGAGYSQQFSGLVTANVDFVRRGYRDRPTLLETNGVYNGNVFVGYANPSFNQIYQLTNNRWNTPVYTSLELSVMKRTNRVQALASYARQWRHIDGSWQPNDPASFVQLPAFENDRGIGRPTGSTSSPDDANSLSGTNMTQSATASAQWQDHAVRAGAAVNGPWHTLLAANYTFQSGAWSGPIIAQVAPNPAFGPATVILPNGRAVANPLATAFRFAYPTRGDGQLRTPALHLFSIRVGRQIAIGRFSANAALDVFNVTNNGADQSFQSGANQTFNPLYGATQYRQLPRSAQAVVRVAF